MRNQNRSYWKQEIVNILRGNRPKKLRTKAMRFADVISTFPITRGCTGLLGRRIDTTRCMKYVVVELGVDGENLYIGKAGAVRKGVNQADSTPLTWSTDDGDMIQQLTQLDLKLRMVAAAENM